MIAQQHGVCYNANIAPKLWVINLKYAGRQDHSVHMVGGNKDSFFFYFLQRRVGEQINMINLPHAVRHAIYHAARERARGENAPRCCGSERLID